MAVWTVTGSSRGLGRAITTAALDAGHQVVATARNPEDVDDLTGLYGDALRVVSLDVTDGHAVAAVISDVVREHGRLDVLVNNAGYGDVASVEDASMEDFRRQIETNFFGVVYGSKAAATPMREQGSGHIIQVSSLGARITGPGLTAYQSAKWAVSGFSGGLAQELAPLGVKVTTIEPGGIRTDWAGSSMTVPRISEPYRQSVGQTAEGVRASSGHEPSDPAAIAGLVLSLTAMDEPPTRLLVGADALEYAARAEQAQRDSDERWRDLSLSVGVADRP